LQAFLSIKSKKKISGFKAKKKRQDGGKWEEKIANKREVEGLYD